MEQEEIKNLEAHWYAINVVSGKENLVADNIRKTVAQLDEKNKCFGKINDVAVIEVNKEVKDKEGMVLKNKDGSIKYKRKNLFPGYIYINMQMTDEAWYLVRNTENVTGITGCAGSRQKPLPIQDKEMEPILKLIGKVNEDMYSQYKVGTKVEVIKGPVTGSIGTIIEAPTKENPMVKLELFFFGKISETTLDFECVKLYNEK